MSEIVDLYTRGIKRRLKNYWAAWLPGTRYAVGDIGTLNGHVFEKVGTLESANLRFHVNEGDDPAPLSISSESGVEISFKAAGETDDKFSHIGKAEAGLKIEFGQSGAFIIEAPTYYDWEIGDRLNLKNQIVQAYKRDKWEKEWLVVTRVLRAPSASVLISKSSNSTLELSANVDFAASTTALGSVAAGITIKHKEGDTIAVVGGTNLTPLFQLSRLKTSFFARPRLEMRGLRASDPSLAELTPPRVKSERQIEDSLEFEVLTDDELPKDELTDDESDSQ